MTRIDQKLGGNGAVNTAAHGDNDALTYPARRYVKEMVHFQNALS